MFKQIFQWFVYSSANPQVISLTLKAGIPLLVLLGLDEVTSTSLIGTLGDTILSLGQFIVACVTFYGLLRKLILSLKK